MNKLILILLMFSLIGCSGGRTTMSPEKLQKVIDSCNKNENIKEIDFFYFMRIFKIICNDGAEFKIDPLE